MLLVEKHHKVNRMRGDERALIGRGRQDVNLDGVRARRQVANVNSDIERCLHILVEEPREGEVQRHALGRHGQPVHQSCICYQWYMHTIKSHSHMLVFVCDFSVTQNVCTRAYMHICTRVPLAQTTCPATSGPRWPATTVHAMLTVPSARVNSAGMRSISSSRNGSLPSYICGGTRVQNPRRRIRYGAAMKGGALLSTFDMSHCLPGHAYGLVVHTQWRGLRYALVQTRCRQSGCRERAEMIRGHRVLAALADGP